MPNRPRILSGLKWSKIATQVWADCKQCQETVAIGDSGQLHETFEAARIHAELTGHTVVIVERNVIEISS